MIHCNTILSQILKLASRHEFRALANSHYSGRALHTATCCRSLSPWRWRSYPVASAYAILWKT